MMRLATGLCLASLLISSSALAQKTYESAGQKFRYETLIKRDDIIWGFDFLADGRIIFTERGGKMNIFDPKTKKVSAVQGLPSLWVSGQGGLLDVRVHPERKNEIFFSYSTPDNGGGTTAIGKAVLKENSLTEFKQIFKAHIGNKNGEHFGSRIEFGKEGVIFFAVGDRNERKQVQDLKFHIGKIMRIKEDGTVPADNPFVKTKDAKPEIWALGVRSPQGLNTHPVTGELWEAEMGPRGGDEVNIIQKGKNYGWPEVTHGREYWGPKIGVPEKKGFEAPLVYWVPSISPSAMNFYTGDVFPQWKNNAFIANLSGQHVRRLVVKDNKIVEQEELLKDLSTRFRNLRGGPDGFLYLSTDDGQISRLVNVK